MNTLHVAAESWWLLRAGAAILLFAHIAGGTVAILAGATALTARKGGRLHRLAGNAFFGSMLVMTSIGATVSLFLVSKQGDPKFFDSLGGFIAFYLAATGWMTVRRKAGTVGRAEVAAMLVAAMLAVAAVLLGSRAAASPTGLVGGYDTTGYYGFGSILALAAALDAKVLFNGGVTGSSRMARHVWRICLAMFIAVGSFFLGQQRVMPAFVQGSPLLDIPPLAVLAIMTFWLLKLRLAKLFSTIKRNRRLRRDAGAAAEPLHQDQGIPAVPSAEAVPLPAAF